MSQNSLKKTWENLKHNIDGYDFYWLSYVEAVPYETNPRLWITKDGIEMMTMEWHGGFEKQNSGLMCKFIAEALTYAKEQYD